MAQKHIIWLLCGMLSISAATNVVLAKINLGYFDEAYGTLAEQHLLNSKVRDQLEQGNTEEAKALLDREINIKGSILAVCLMKSCSKSAKDVMLDRAQL